MDTNYRLGQALLIDIPTLQDIQKDSFGFCWDERQWADEVRCDSNFVTVVRQKCDSTPICGFSISNLYSSRLMVNEILVHPGFRRRRIGTLLVQALKEEMNPHMPVIEWVDSDCNLEMQQFFVSCNFWLEHRFEQDGGTHHLYRYDIRPKATLRRLAAGCNRVIPWYSDHVMSKYKEREKRWAWNINWQKHPRIR